MRRAVAGEFLLVAVIISAFLGCQKPTDSQMADASRTAPESESNVNSDRIGDDSNDTGSERQIPGLSKDDEAIEVGMMLDAIQRRQRYRDEYHLGDIEMESGSTQCELDPTQGNLRRLAEEGYWLDFKRRNGSESERRLEDLDTSPVIKRPGLRDGIDHNPQYRPIGPGSKWPR